MLLLFPLESLSISGGMTGQCQETAFYPSAINLSACSERMWLGCQVLFFFLLFFFIFLIRVPDLGLWEKGLDDMT